MEGLHRVIIIQTPLDDLLTQSREQGAESRQVQEGEISLSYPRLISSRN